MNAKTWLRIVLLLALALPGCASAPTREELAEMSMDELCDEAFDGNGYAAAEASARNYDCGAPNSLQAANRNSRPTLAEVLFAGLGWALYQAWINR